MLTITENAGHLLASQRDESGAPDTFGVRLSRPPDMLSTETDLIVASVPEAKPGDVITDQAGIRAFVAPDVVAELDRATLDATPLNGMPPHLVLRRSVTRGDPAVYL